MRIHYSLPAVGAATTATADTSAGGSQANRNERAMGRRLPISSHLASPLGLVMGQPASSLARCESDRWAVGIVWPTEQYT